MQKEYLFMVLILLLCNSANSELLQYFKSLGSYFGYGNKEQELFNNDILDHNVPYEVSVIDEKFISEAAKLTGVTLSELDSCQHRVVLRLQTSCGKMNDEQLAKMAVMLLNCQSSVEGRQLYPCTDVMSIKDCTSSMDPDAWNTYHLMSNRVRAVCYSIRQIQFRGLTEYTVNRLMKVAHEQLFHLNKIAKDQENLHKISQNSLNLVTQGQIQLSEQQKSLEMAQLHSQLSIEDNLRRLSNEKHLIEETHQELTDMAHSVQDEIQQAAIQLENQASQARVNHQQLLDDLISIQNKVQLIFERIDDSAKLLLQQNQMAHQQYKVTVVQLAEVNTTIHALVALVGDTKKELDQQLAWINTALGGTDLAVDRLYAILWHIGFLLIAMISCAFLGAQTITRVVVVIAPSLNLILTLQQSPYALNLINLIVFVIGFVFVHTLTFWTIMLWKSKIIQQALPRIKQRLTPQKTSNGNLNTMIRRTSQYQNSYKVQEPSQTAQDTESDEETELPSLKYSSLTRSRSRTPLLNGFNKTTCNGRTRTGSLCKLSVLNGRNYCYRHQNEDSIYDG